MKRVLVSTLAFVACLFVMTTMIMTAYAEEPVGDASGNAIQTETGESTVSSDDKVMIQAEVAKEDGATVVEWFNITRTDPEDTSAQEVVLESPSFVAEEGYEYHVYYVHDGVFHDLGVYTPVDGKITFTSSDFSTYAVVKVPVETTPEDTTPADTTPADTTPADTTPADTTPVTPAPAYTIVNTSVEG